MPPGPTAAAFRLSPTGRPHSPSGRGQRAPLHARSSRTMAWESTFVRRFRLALGCAPFRYGLHSAIRSFPSLRSTLASPKTRPKRVWVILTFTRKQFRDSRSMRVFSFRFGFPIQPRLLWSLRLLKRCHARDKSRTHLLQKRPDSAGVTVLRWPTAWHSSYLAQERRAGLGGTVC